MWKLEKRNELANISVGIPASAELPNYSFSLFLRWKHY